MSAVGMLPCLACGALAALSVWQIGHAGVRALLAAWARRLKVGLLRASAAAEGSRPFAHGARRVAGVFGRRARKAREGRLKGERRDRCLDELPELIDVVALGLSAGVSFDAALEIYCGRYQTMLAGYLGDAMRSWQLGLSSRAASLRELARSLDVDAFTTFVETVTESLAFGAPLAQSLAGQAQAVRDARRSVIEERIEKAPVKMLIPTGVLVLPAMLVAIVGPLLASLAQSS